MIALAMLSAGALVALLLIACFSAVLLTAFPSLSRVAQ